MKSARTRRILVSSAKFIIPLAIIGYLLWRIEPQQWRELADQPKSYGLLFLALVVALGAISMSFARWHLLVRCQGIELSVLEAFRLSSICFLLSFVSAGSVGGDLFKAIFLAQRRPGKKVAAVASVLVDRGCGLYALLLLVGAGLMLTHPDSPQEVSDAEGVIGIEQIKWVTIALLAVGTTALATLVFGGRSVDRWISSLGDKGVLGSLISRVGPPLRMFHAHPVAFLVAILMSLFVQMAFVVSIYLIARGLYSSPPTLLEHAVIVPIGMLASALPITPAGIGVFEAAIQSLYIIVPATPTTASGTLVALVFEIVKVLMAAIGTIFYWTANEEVRHSLELAEHDSSDSGGVQLEG